VLLGTPVVTVADGFVDGLLKAGIPLWRAHLAVSTLDPQHEAVGFTWQRDGARDREDFSHGSFSRISRGSPIYDAVIEARARAAASTPGPYENLLLMNRYRLAEGEGLERYPILTEFRAEGATDYLVFVAPFSLDGVLHPVRSGAVITLATDHPQGFSPTDLA